MMTEDRFLEEMRAMLRELDPPPPPPREAMWARIQARRGLAAATQTPVLGTVRETRLRARRTLPAWVRWAPALAAMLVIGIGLGVSIHRILPPDAIPPARSAPQVSADNVPAPYRFAATQYLQRTEALLTSLVVDAPVSRDEVSVWARDLLTDTRLLLASPASRDAALSRLLEDLELVLAQIAAIPAERAQDEVRLIHDDINQSDVLLRLRAATAGRTPTGT